jgi:hypothetical protein
VRFPLPMLFVAFLMSGQSASAQQANVTGAKISWFGNYTSKSKVIKDSAISTGKHSIDSETVAPKVNSDQITLTPNTKFGFGFTLTGKPLHSRVVLRQVYKYPSPGMPIGGTGTFKRSDELPFTYAIGPGNAMGYTIGGQFLPQWPTGVWTFQLWSGANLLTEKNFTLSRP